MAFFLRKALKLGPVRLNLSKSGVGVSAGATGARVGIRADGQPYVFGGRRGLYFRQNLGSTAGTTNSGDLDLAATEIAAILEQATNQWLPTIRTLNDATASEEAKAAAANTFQEHSIMVRDHLNAQGFDFGPDDEVTQVISEIHADLILQRAFPEHYDAWNAASEELFVHARKEINKLVRKHQGETRSKLANQQPLNDVINDLGNEIILPHLKRQRLLLEDNPVYAMRLGSAVSDAILNELSNCIPDDTTQNVGAPEASPEASPQTRSENPNLRSDEGACTHEGETSTYCTKCWTNLWQLRQQ